MSARTIQLELLRHGGARGQLLSPTTSYLALCGDHAAQTLQLPLDHLDYLSRTEGLRYRGGDPFVIGAALREARRDVTRVLASIPALAAELAAAAEERVVHLRLVLSAAELASLPFELADAPPGTPNEGEQLFLDGNLRVVLTRAARRVAPPPVPWPRRPRVLFAFASPRRPLPVDAHLLALRRALDPWIGWGDSSVEELKRFLTVLPNASLSSIDRACREACQDGLGPFTHVHVLAHGVTRPVPGTREMRHYLSLHRAAPAGGEDPVDGKRLEEAVRPLEAARRALAVVTVASCDSGNVGSVIASGGSIAHELHESGIPFVVASQFPLTFGGSVILADNLYGALLSGADPIVATHEVRRRLHGLASDENHDWASLVVYSSLPPDIDAQVARARFDHARKTGDVAVARAERMLGKTEMLHYATPDEKRLDQAVANMSVIAAEQPTSLAVAATWRASMAARWADALIANVPPSFKANPLDLVAVKSPRDQPTPGSIVELPLREVLRAAEDAYREAFRADPSLRWALVQAINLQWARTGKVVRDEWISAVWLAKQDLCAPSKALRSSAHDDLAQLYLLQPAVPPCAPLPPPTASPSGDLEQLVAPPPGVDEARVREHVDALLQIEGPRSWVAFTLRRQLVRRAKVWRPSPVETAAADTAIREVAGKLLATLDERQVPRTWGEH